MENGYHYGLQLLKLQKNVEMRTNVSARNAVLDTANAARPTESVHSCVIVVDNALSKKYKNLYVIRIKLTNECSFRMY